MIFDIIFFYWVILSQILSIYFDLSSRRHIKSYHNLIITIKNFVVNHYGPNERCQNHTNINFSWVHTQTGCKTVNQPTILGRSARMPAKIQLFSFLFELWLKLINKPQTTDVMNDSQHKQLQLKLLLLIIGHGDRKHAKKTYHNGTANHFISIGKEIVLKKENTYNM